MNPNQQQYDVEHKIVSMILTDSSFLNVAVNSGIRSEFFKDRRIGNIFSCMMEHIDGKFDITSLSTEYPKICDIGFLIDLQSCVDIFSAENNFTVWCDAMKLDYSRRLIKATLQNALKTADSTEVGKLLGSVFSGLENAQKVGYKRKQTSLKESAEEAILNSQRISKDFDVPWFSENSAGRNSLIHKHREIVTLAGESGTGKTELSLGSCVIPTMESGKRILYICTESASSELLGRLAGLKCGVPYSWVNGKKDISYEMRTRWANEVMSIPEKYSKNLFICGNETGIDSVEDISAEMEIINNQYGFVDLLVIDFLQDLRRYNNESEHDAISRQIQSIKAITDKFGCATLINSQMNRTNSKTSEKPNKYRLLGSGVIEHKSHILAFLWKNPQNGEIELFSDKTRTIQPFSIKLTFGLHGYVSNPVNEHKY